jgi:cytochrome P450
MPDGRAPVHAVGAREKSTNEPLTGVAKTDPAPPVTVDPTQPAADPAPPLTVVNSRANAGLQTLFDMSAPQHNYQRVLEEGGYVQPLERMALSFDRSTTEYVLRRHDVFSSVVDLNLGNVRPMIPLNVDPPRHAKYRKLLDPLFSPRRMEEREADIAGRVNGFIDQFVDRGQCNFTEELAELFPSSVFLGLMGLPESDLRLFLRLRDGSLHPEKVDSDAAVDFDKRTAIVKANGLEIYDYFGKLIDERLALPTGDIVSRLLSAEVDGDKLTREEILDILFLMLIAGLDTVSDSLTCFYAFLATHPDHRRAIVEDPTVIPSAVEELLRWETPVPGGVPRVAVEDTELPNGHTVKAGTAVVVIYGAANLDPGTCPDAFDVRFDRDVNPHLAFGGGVHRCLGSHLARRELRVTLREWHRRIPDYWITPGHERLEYPPGLRHVKDLMLSWA